MKKLITQLTTSTKELIHKNETADKLIRNYDFRTLVFSAFPFAGGIGLAVFNIVVYGITNSLWCGAMAFYHILLVVLRGYVLFAYYKAKKKAIKSAEEQTLLEIKRYRFCGIVLNYVKVQQNDSYTVRSLRCINLTTALVSFISLQAIALDTFSKNVDIPIGNAITGFVICGLIVASGVYMIVHSTLKIKAFKTNAENIMHRS